MSQVQKEHTKGQAAVAERSIEVVGHLRSRSHLELIFIVGGGGGGGGGWWGVVVGHGRKHIAPCCRRYRDWVEAERKKWPNQYTIVSLMK